MTSILSRFKERRREPEKPPAATRIFNLNDRKLTDDYTVRDVLGKGSFSTVRRAVHRVTGDVVAVKIIDKNSIDVKVEALKMEVRILLSIKHPNIVNLIDVYEDDSFVYLAMELMTGGELFDRICNDYPTGYSEREAAVLIRKIFEAVKYLHENGVIHRDLKPENLLFSTPEKTGTEIKISDFGLAKIRSGDALVRTACGSPNYVAPEVLTHDMKGYSFACDMWSLGVILYVLLCGFCPFYDESTPALFQAIIAGEYSFPSPYWDGISDAAKDLVRKLLLVDPDARLTPAAALAHPWLAGPAPSAVIPHIGDQMRKFQSDRSRAAMAAPP